MIVLGLTGSIGMGKSTTAALFREAGAPVQDADAVVADLYGPGGAAVGRIGKAFPGVVEGGAIDRSRLLPRIMGDPDAFARLEAIVHPLVQADRAAFLKAAKADGAPVAVLDVPLLFEVGLDREVDAVVVVSAPAEVQRDRVLARPGMTPETFEQILLRQLPDAEKRARADFVIDTRYGLDAARGDVGRVLAAVQAPGWRSQRPK